jgi:hypothetical protein
MIGLHFLLFLVLLRLHHHLPPLPGVPHIF